MDINNSDNEKSIEQIFAEFIQSIKELPEEDLDTIYNNLKDMEEDNTNNDTN